MEGTFFKLRNMMFFKKVVYPVYNKINCLFYIQQFVSQSKSLINFFGHFQPKFFLCLFSVFYYRFCWLFSYGA
jgi:hypothetical protein